MLPLPTRHDNNTANYAENLRRNAEGNLIPVLPPLRLPALAGMKPLCRLDGNKLLLCRDSILYTASDDGGEANQIADAGATVLCAARQSADTVVVMTTKGAVRLSREGTSYSLRGTEANFPAIGLHADNSGILITTVPQRRLAKGLIDGMLADADVRSLSNDLCNAYRELARLGAASACAIQPALARYKLYDHGGRLLYTSPCVLLSHAEGTQCAGSIELFSPDRSVISAYTLQASTWRPAIELPYNEEFAAIVARADIYMSPLFHPFMPGDTAAIYLTRNDDASNAFARVTLPGADCGLSNIYAAGSTLRLRSAVAHMDDIERCVCSVSMPFSRACTLRPDIAFDGRIESSAADLAAVLRRPVAVYTKTAALCRPPHSFSAAVCASNSGTTAWGNITIHHAAPPSAAAFACATEAKPWRATVAVRFADGTGVSYSEEHDSGAPSLFNPVLSYPAPDAVEMTILLYSDGHNYRGDFDLQADNSGLRSVYTAPELKPFALAACGAGAILDFSAPSYHLPDVVLLCDSHNPLTVDNMTSIGGDMESLIPGAASDQAWNFGRCRFIAAGSRGISAIGVGAGRARLSLRTLFAEGIARHDAITTDSIGNIYAVAGGKLLKIDTKSRLTLMDSDTKHLALALNEHKGELWCLQNSGSIKVVCTDTDESFVRSDTSLSEFFDIDGRIYGLCEDSLLRLDREMRSPKIKIAYSRFVCPAHYHSNRPHSLHAVLYSSSIEGRIAIEGCGVAAKNRRTIRSAAIEGACRGTVGFCFATRPVRAFRLIVEGIVNYDFVLADIHII